MPFFRKGGFSWGKGGKEWEKGTFSRVAMNAMTFRSHEPESNVSTDGTHGIGHRILRDRMVLAMADEITKETLLNRVKEQGEIVRQLKAAQTDKTQVSINILFFPFLSLFFPPFHAKISTTFRHVHDRCTAFLFFVLKLYLYFVLFVTSYNHYPLHYLL